MACVLNEPFFSVLPAEKSLVVVYYSLVSQSLAELLVYSRACACKYKQKKGLVSFLILALRGIFRFLFTLTPEL